MHVMELLIWPFLACLVLTGIHCYLGIHVVARGVIFVDLAMAQIAFLGSAVAVFAATSYYEYQYRDLSPESRQTAVRSTDQPPTASVPTTKDTRGRPADDVAGRAVTQADVDSLIPPDTNSSSDLESSDDNLSANVNQLDRQLGRHMPVRYAGGLLFTLLGAAVFSLGRMRHRQIPQEAVIGIIYAVCSAAALVLLFEAPHDVAEQTEDMLVGQILFVDRAMVLKTAALYAVVGGLHVLLRRPLLLISFQPEVARAAGMSLRSWDFLFYATFGVIVTSSVQMAGILLVFSYLIVPSVCAMMFFEGIGARLCCGWAIGFLASVLGIGLSVWADIPTGASIVITFGLIAVVLAAVRGLTRSKSADC